MRGPRQCLRVDVLPDIRQLAVPDGNGEDEMVLESLVVALIFPLAKPTTRTRSPCATNSLGSVDVSIDLDAV